MDIKNYRYRLPKELQEGCELFLASLPGYNQDPGLSIWPDISGHNRHGVIHGATWELGQWGWELRFDGVDDYVEILAPDITSELSICYVSKIDLDINDWSPLIYQYNWVLDESKFIIDVDSNDTVGCTILNGLSIRSSHSITNEYDIVCCSVSPGNFAYFRDNGFSRQTTTLLVSINSSILPIIVRGKGTTPFVAIWSRALTEEQIKILNEFIEGTKA